MESRPRPARTHLLTAAIRAVTRERRLGSNQRQEAQLSRRYGGQLEPTHTRATRAPLHVVCSRSAAHRYSGLAYGPARTLHAERRDRCEHLPGSDWVGSSWWAQKSQARFD